MNYQSRGTSKSDIQPKPYQGSSLYNFISSEWYKLIRSRFFYICILANAGIAALLDISVKISGEAYGPLRERLNGAEHTSQTVNGLLQLVQFSEEGNPAWAAAYSFSNMGVIIGAIFVILFLSMEYKKGTMLILIGRGYSRIKLIVSKIIVAILGMGVIQVITAIVSFGTGMIIWGFPKGTAEMLPDMLLSLGCNMILAVGSLAPAMVLAVLLKSSGAAIGVFMVADLLLSNAAGIGRDAQLLSDKVMSVLFVDMQMAKIANILDKPKIPWFEMGVSVCYIALAVVICCYLIQKKDLN